MKLAQYEVLGNGCKRRGRPVGTIETLASHSHMLPYESNVDRPVGTRRLLKHQPSTSYWASSSSPSGTSPLRISSNF
jgi:hypothetical protein